MILNRLMTEEDIPWLRELFLRRYPKNFDELATRGWFVNVVLRQPLLFAAIRSSDAFVITMLSASPWTPTLFEANVVCVCVDDRVPGAVWQCVGLLRGSVYWARLRKCVAWRCSSDTDFDIAPMVFRIGGEENSPRFVINLEYDK